MVDASAVVALLLNQRSAARLRERLAGEATLHAPHLLDLEVTQVLRRAVRRGLLPEAAVTARLADLEALRLLRYPHAPFLKRIWDLRANLSAYDAAYVALAETLAAPLITLDRPLSLTPGHQAVIEFYGEAEG